MFFSDCGGITYEPKGKKYTLRQGRVPKKSNSGEVSWIKNTSGVGTDSPGKLEITSITIGVSGIWATTSDEEVYTLINDGTIILTIFMNVLYDLLVYNALEILNKDDTYFEDFKNLD